MIDRLSTEVIFISESVKIFSSSAILKDRSLVQIGSASLLALFNV